MKWWIVYFLSTRLIWCISKTNKHIHTRNQIGYKLEVVNNACTLLQHCKISVYLVTTYKSKYTRILG